MNFDININIDSILHIYRIKIADKLIYDTFE